MALTGPDGAPITSEPEAAPEAPPMTMIEPPTQENIDSIRDECVALEQAINATGGFVSPLVVLAAKVETLISTLGREGTPARMAFDYAVAARTKRNLEAALAAHEEEVRRGPGLLVPGVSIPPELIPPGVSGSVHPG